MKINAKIAALAGAAVLFGASSAVAQDYSYDTYTTTEGNTTTTVTTTTVTTETTDTTVAYDYDANDYVDEYSETTTSTVTRVYDGYVSIPVETTTETTYTVRTGTPEETWSTADFFAPGSFTLTNEIGSDIVKARGSFDKDKNDKEYAVEFGGIYDKVDISYDAKRLKFQLAPKFALGSKYEDLWNDSAYTETKGKKGTATDETSSWYGLNADDVGLYWDSLDWFVELWPWEVIALELHHDVWTPGAYEPVRDSHVSAGNLGGDGFGVIAHPLDGLKLAAQLPFGFSLGSTPNWLNAENEDATEWKTAMAGVTDVTTLVSNPWENYKFRINLGAEYNLFNFLTVGATLQNLLDKATVGGYFALTGLENVTANLGVTYGLSGNATEFGFDYWELPSAKVDGQLLFNLGAGITFGSFNVGLDAVLGFIEDSYYDLYVGLGLGYALTDRFDVGLKGFVGADFDDDKNLIIGFKPNLTYHTGSHEFGAAAVIELGGADYDLDIYHVKFPVYWKYRF